MRACYMNTCRDTSSRDEPKTLHGSNYTALFSTSEQAHCTLDSGVYVPLHSGQWCIRPTALWTVVYTSHCTLDSGVYVPLHSGQWCIRPTALWTVVSTSHCTLDSGVYVPLHSGQWCLRPTALWTVVYTSHCTLDSGVYVPLHSGQWCLRPTLNERLQLVAPCKYQPKWLRRRLVVTWLVPRETAAVLAHVPCTLCNHALVYSVTLLEATYAKGACMFSCLPPALLAE